eukprot:1520952-Amphidinium_carterae.1
MFGDVLCGQSHKPDFYAAETVAKSGSNGHLWQALCIFEMLFKIMSGLCPWPRSLVPQHSAA